MQFRRDHIDILLFEAEADDKGLESALLCMCKQSVVMAFSITDALVMAVEAKTGHEDAVDLFKGARGAEVGIGFPDVKRRLHKLAIGVIHLVDEQGIAFDARQKELFFCSKERVERSGIDFFGKAVK